MKCDEKQTLCTGVDQFTVISGVFSKEIQYVVNIIVRREVLVKDCSQNFFNNDWNDNISVVTYAILTSVAALLVLKVKILRVKLEQMKSGGQRKYVEKAEGKAMKIHETDV